MKAIYSLLAVVFLFSLGSCAGKNEKKAKGIANFEAIAEANKDSAVLVREQKLREKLLGKKISILKTIIPSYKEDEMNMVLVISKFDCNSCVYAGYDIVRKVRASRSVINTYAVGVTNQVLIPKNYKETVYEDKKQELLSSLNYSPTPIILVFQGERIVGLHTPEDATSEHSKNFMNEYPY